MDQGFGDSCLSQIRGAGVAEDLHGHPGFDACLGGQAGNGLAEGLGVEEASIFAPEGQRGGKEGLSKRLGESQAAGLSRVLPFQLAFSAVLVLAVVLNFEYPALCSLAQVLRLKAEDFV